MTIVSLSFVALITVTALLYFMIPMKYRWVVLLAASYVFYFANSKWLVLVMLATTLCTFWLARWIYAINMRGEQEVADAGSGITYQEKRTIRMATRQKSRRILILGVCIDLGILLFLKYSNFFASGVNLVLPDGLEIRKLNLLLPIGISFYTLQAIGYLADIYRAKYEPDKDPLKFMLFMSFFPQIVQGPIPRHNHLAHQLYEGHRFDYDRLMKGIQLMLWGWMKKMIIADRIAIPVTTIFDNPTSYSGIMILMGAIGYSFQVYADFSGGMDVVRGVSQIFGIELELNFTQPYFAKSIEEFWRRWHITLGGWMRDYVFYPLSLSKTFGRMGKAAMKTFGKYIGKRLPAFLAMFIVYFIVGFWHGPDMKYIIYGVWNGLFIVSGILLEEPYKKLREKLHIRENAWAWCVFQMLRTFCLCAIGRLFSRANSLKLSFVMLYRMLARFTDASAISPRVIGSLGLDMANWIVLVLAIVILMIVDVLHEREVKIRDAIGRQNIIVRWIIFYFAVILIAVFGIYGPLYDSASFIYEQF